MPEHYVHTEISLQRLNYYERLTHKFVEEYGSEFRDFVEELGKLRRRGDYRIRRVDATGYNILRTISTMDLQSENRILFYNNGIESFHHFGLLLAELEQEGLIEENEISFGVKSSTVITNKLGEKPSWQPTSKRLIRRIHKNGEIDVVAVQDTLELVLAISVRDEDHAIALANFFTFRTAAIEGTREGEAAIEGSWRIPDVRATNNLSEVLLRDANYIPVVANMSAMGRARLIVLRDETELKRAKSHKTPINQALHKYIVMYDVPK